MTALPSRVMTMQTDGNNHDGALILTVKETAEMLRVPTDTITNLHRVGKLRGRKIGKHLRWRRTDVVAFVEALEE